MRIRIFSDFCCWCWCVSNGCKLKTTDAYNALYEYHKRGFDRALMVYGFSLAIIGLALLVLITCVLAAIIIVYLFT